MNSMTVDGRDAPWWDDYRWIPCPECDGEGYFYAANSCKQCPTCEGYGEITERL